MINTGIKNDLFVLMQLTKRDLKIFLKDRLTVFFSLLAPLIVLLLYVLFLGNIQYDSIVAQIPEGVNFSEQATKAFLDSWMISGVMCIACITVSLGANSVMVRDKHRGSINDFISAPIKKWTITFSYFLANYVITVLICLVAFAVSILYLVINAHFFLSLADVSLTVCILLLSALLATVMTVFITGFFKSEAALGGFNGIMSAMIGFLTGAYMPISMFPKPVQYFIGIFPQTYSGGLFRKVITRGAFENLTKEMPVQLADAIGTEFAMEMELFGKTISAGTMLLVIFGSIAVFIALNMLFGQKISGAHKLKNKQRKTQE